MVILARTRWGKIVDHEDFYVDTGRIAAFDQKLRELGVDPLTPEKAQGPITA